MKFILFFAATLFHIACNANYVTLIQPERLWNPIVSDSGIEIAHQSNKLTVSVPSTILFSAQHKHFHHHSYAPTYNLDSMDTDQLACYFAAHNYTEGEILSHPLLYMNSAYLVLVKQLPRYSEFVKKYYERYRSYSKLYKFWKIINFRYKKGLADQFEQLYRECEEQRLTKEVQERRDREERRQKIKATAAYCAKFDQHGDDNMIQDAIPYYHQQARNRAYEQIKVAASDRTTQRYIVTQDVITFAQEHDLTEQALTSLHGNAYEHQLHTEFLEQLNKARTISSYYALQPKNILIDAVCNCATIGMEANRLQEPGIATAWANLGWKALEIMQGMGDAVLLSAEHIMYIAQDPKGAAKEFIQGLGNIVGYCARMIGTVAYWHELMEQGNGLLMAQEMDDVADKIALCSTLCAEKLAAMSAREIAKNITHIAIDMVLTHKMIMLGSHLCSELKPIIFDLIQNIRKEEVFIEFASQGLEEVGGVKKISILMQEAEEACSIKNIHSSTAQQSSQTVIQPSGSLTETIWVSKSGLIYGPDKKFGTRINHILQHTKSNNSKLNHTIFTMTGDELFDLIDFAWSKKGGALIDDPGTYIIELEKIIGTQGEKAIKIVVIPGTNQIITAYPIKV